MFYIYHYKNKCILPFRARSEYHSYTLSTKIANEWDSCNRIWSESSIIYLYTSSMVIISDDVEWHWYHTPSNIWELGKIFLLLKCSSFFPGWRKTTPNAYKYIFLTLEHILLSNSVIYTHYIVEMYILHSLRCDVVFIIRDNCLQT